jgi:hypothetical protein
VSTFDFLANTRGNSFGVGAVSSFRDGEGDFLSSIVSRRAYAPSCKSEPDDGFPLQPLGVHYIVNDRLQFLFCAVVFIHGRLSCIAIDLTAATPTVHLCIVSGCCEQWRLRV